MRTALARNALKIAVDAVVSLSALHVLQAILLPNLKQLATVSHAKEAAASA